MQSLIIGHQHEALLRVQIGLLWRANWGAFAHMLHEHLSVVDDDNRGSVWIMKQQMVIATNC